LFVAAGGGRAGREGDPCVEEAVPHGIKDVGAGRRVRREVDSESRLFKSRKVKSRQVKARQVASSGDKHRKTPKVQRFLEDFPSSKEWLKF
jgi:hypothetical protein